MSDSALSSLTPASYNRWSRYLHWLVAGLILFTIILGWRHEDHDSLRLTRITLHKSIGILILLLCFTRLGLRMAYKAPPEPPMPAWQALAAKALHVGFYVVMIAMPLTGWLMVSTSPRPVPFFFLELPHLPVPAGEETAHQFHETFETVHGLIAKLLIYAMIPLHALAALKHQFIDKDAVIQHMVPGLTPKPILNWRWIVPLGVVVAAVGLGYGLYRGTPEKGGEGPPPRQVIGGAVGESAVATSASGSELASQSAPTDTASKNVTYWMVNEAATKVEWSTTFQGEPVNGVFGSYAAAIGFDPAKLDKSHVKVTIDLASVASGNDDYDGSLKSDSFFNTGVYPTAIYEASRFTKKDVTHFVAHGKLTMHGVTKPLDLPFTLVIKGDLIGNADATMTASTSLDRTMFGIGSGDYAGTDAIPAKVNISIHLKASNID